MRIALNLLYLIPRVVGGSETYARSLIRALADLDRANEYIVFVNRETRDETLTSAPNFRVVQCDVRATNRLARYAFEQTALPRLLRQHGAELVHSLGYVGPLLAPCPHVVSIYDLNYIGHGSAMAAGRRVMLRAFVSAMARRADHILTISEFSRQQILAEFSLPPNRVTVTHLAGRSPSNVDGAGIRERHGLARPYIVAFSSPFGHKNLPRLIHAFAAIAGDIPHSLVLIGRAHRTLRAEAARFPFLNGRLVFTDYVPDQDVEAILAAADLLVFPSLYEGFGLPIVDAHELGIPVAASSAASLPEVGGGGAMYFDPTSVPDISASVRRCLLDADYRSGLAAGARENVHRFSWHKTASLTLETYERVVRAT